MKLNKWFLGAAAVAMMASCSDDISNVPDGGAPAEEGQGYIGINIQLPTTKGTRGYNDDFENGELTEYSVNDAVLLLFQGADEASATCKGAYTLQEAEPVYDGGQVTRHSVRVANVNGLTLSQNLYALVMVNGVANGLYTQAQPTASWMPGKTIQQLQEYVLNKGVKLFDQKNRGAAYANNIFMVNSPLSPINGGERADAPTVSDPLPVLVQLNPTTYPTQSEAIAKPAGTIHVERAVAKITCSEFTKNTGENGKAMEVTIDGFKYKLEVESVSWDMAQDMGDTYLVRNTRRQLAGATDGTNLWSWSYASDYVTPANYRMLGHEVLSSLVNELKPGENEGDESTWVSSTKSFFRPYFCQVPGYGVGNANDDKDPNTYENKNFIKDTMEAKDAVAMTGTSSFSSTGAFYPRENTFPVEYMKYANTTRVGFWVTFKFTPVSGQTDAPSIGKDVNFYINGMDKTTLYLDDKDGYDPLTNRALAALSDTEKYEKLWEAIKAALDKDESVGGSVENIRLQDLIKITYNTYDEVTNKNGDKDGSIEITGIEFKSVEALNAIYHNDDNVGYFASKPDFEFNDNIIAELNNLGQFYRYTGGKVFYETRIKHFGDELTPWVPTGVSATTINESYGENPTTRKKNYLGRYGIVRNNWYDLKVTKILNLGYPEDPAKWDSSWPGKPDDNKDQFIAVELRVLSWAKRSQNVEF